MIEAYIGKMRSGKTLAMTKRVEKELDSGKIVYVNYRVNWDPERKMGLTRRFFHLIGFRKKRYPQSNLRTFRNWEDVANISNCVVALDEGWMYFDSYQKLPMEKRMRLYQSGKWELDFLYTVQRYMMADINLRWNTQWFHESTLYNVPFLKYPLIIYRTYDLEEDDEGAKIARKGIKPNGDVVDLAVKSRWLLTTKRLFSLYDTKEDIYATDELRARLSEKNDARTSDSTGYYDSSLSIPHYLWGLVKGNNVNRRITKPKRRKKSTPSREQGVVVDRVRVRRDDGGIRVVGR